MKLWTSTALALLVTQNIPPLPQQSQVPMASIEGIVLRADNGDAIAKAQVTLSRPAPVVNPANPVTTPPPIPPVMTDASGKFLFKDLEPGTYRLSATKNGFVRFDYGARSIGGTGTQFNLVAGQSMKDISFRLVNTGVVSGRVRTSSGEPGAALNIQ